MAINQKPLCQFKIKIGQAVTSDREISVTVCHQLVTITCHHQSLNLSPTCHQFLATCHQLVTMPNPRLTVRVPQNIYDALPTDEKERSAFLLEAITAKPNPPAPEDEIAQLKRRVETLERQIGL